MFDGDVGRKIWSLYSLIKYLWDKASEPGHGSDKGGKQAKKKLITTPTYTKRDREERQLEGCGVGGKRSGRGRHGDWSKRAMGPPKVAEQPEDAGLEGRGVSGGWWLGQGV